MAGVLIYHVFLWYYQNSTAKTEMQLAILPDFLGFFCVFAQKVRKGLAKENTN